MKTNEDIFIQTKIITIVADRFVYKNIVYIFAKGNCNRWKHRNAGKKNTMKS